MNNRCVRLADFFICGFICQYGKYLCESNNCKECKFCGDDLICLSCKDDNYQLSDDERACNKKAEADQPVSDKDDDIKCYQNCLNCSSSSTYNNMNCISCQKNFYKINGTDNCFDLTLLNESFYINNDKFYPCDESCLTCSGMRNKTTNNCLSCDNERKGLYKLEDKNNCEYSNFSGYYLNKEEKILKRYHESCKTCNGPYKIDEEKILKIIIVLNV